MAERQEIAEIFGDEPAHSAKGDDIEREIARLTAILNADFRLLWTTQEGVPVQLSPSEWPDELQPAIRRVQPTAHGLTVEFEEKTKAADQLAKLTGLYRNDDENANPLEAAFARIPREQLLLLKKGLDRLAELEGEKDDDDPFA